LNHEVLLRKFGVGTHYLYCDLEDIALRINIDHEMAEVHIKHRGKREFKGSYDSRLANLAFSREPAPISKEEYYHFK